MTEERGERNNQIQYTREETTNMIANLIEHECITQGYYRLKSGYKSKYYFNMKKLMSVPILLKEMADKLYHMLDEFDVICAIPYGGMPIASYISLKYNKPMIYLRDKTKTYGEENLIEGKYTENSRCVIIDDVFTSGNSLRQAVKVLNSKVRIVDIGVLMNRQESFSDLIDDWRVKSVLYKNDYIKYQLKSISESKNCRLCFAADIEDAVRLFDILEKVGPHIAVCKIHYDIINVKDYENTAGGANKNFIEDLIKLSIRHNFLIMEDRKFMDISYIVAKQYAQFSGWIDLVTVHALATNDVLAGLSGALVVANMSNNNYNYYEKAAELTRNNKNNVVGYISQNKIEADGLVCMTPGVRNEQRATGGRGPVENIRVGDQDYRSPADINTDYIIVGRDIYKSKNIAVALQVYMRYGL